MAVNDKFQVKITGQYQGDVWQNVLYFMQTAGPGGGITADTHSLLLAVQNTILPLMAAAMVDKSTILAMRAQQVGVAAPYIERKGEEIGGVVSTDGLPAQDAVLIQRRCNVGGRKNVGKFFLAAVPEEWVTGGVVDVTQSELIALMVALKDSVTNASNTFRHIIWHRSDSTAEFITQCGIRSQISRQSRRHLPVI